MIIKPYSDISDETFNAADFPALKHFWACKQGAVAAGGTLTDVVAGANALIGAGATLSGNGLVMPVASHGVAELTAPATSPCLLIACGTWGATGGLSYGATGGAGQITVGTQAAGAAINDGATTKNTSGTQTASQAFTRATFIAAAGGVLATATMFEVNSTTLDVYTNTADLTAATAITTVAAIEPALTIVGSSHTIFGVAFFKFATLPPNDVIQAAAAWCDYQWRNNSNVTMYPGFKGLA